MKKALALAALTFALVGCSSQAAIAPLSAPQTPTDAPTPTASYEGSYASPEDEQAFVALVERDWQGATVPPAEELIAAGYEVCTALQEEVAVDDERFPQWSGLDNMAVHFAAGAALCPADA